MNKLLNDNQRDLLRNSKVGKPVEIEYEGKNVKVVACRISCIGCFFYKDENSMCYGSFCTEITRPDGETVFFKKVK